jgi:hypothetical protein
VALRRKDEGIRGKWGILVVKLPKLMAKVTDNLLLKGMSGPVGDRLLRTFKNKTFSGKIPDMSGITPSQRQVQKRKLFAAAVKYAQSVLKESGQNTKDNAKAGSLYHAAIKDFLTFSKSNGPSGHSLPKTVKSSLQVFSLNDHELLAVAFIKKNKKLTNRIYRGLTGLSKATATRHLQELVRFRIIQSNKGRGAGAYYIIGSFFKK